MTPENVVRIQAFVVNLEKDAFVVFKIRDGIFSRTDPAGVVADAKGPAGLARIVRMEVSALTTLD